MKTIQDEVHAFVVDNFLFGQDADRLRDDESLLEAGIMDSTGVLELLAHIEQQYAISIADDELLPANLDSVERVARFVARKLQVRNAMAS